ncbi:MAG: hypothetical protein ACYSU7_01580 [Planctomycetota bacterium]|jgi:hypothetical protein
MRHGFLFSLARAGALFSIAGAPVIVIADARPVRAAPPGDGPSGPGGVVARGPGAPQIRFRKFLDRFWQEAWGTGFSLHESGMTLEPADGPGPRVMLVHDGAQPAGTGVYHELARLDLSTLDHAPLVDASFSFEHFVSAGIAQGSTGRAVPMYGLVQRVVFAPAGPKPIVVEGITPLGMTDTLDAALTAALETQDLLTDATDGSDDAPPYDPDDDLCRCDEVYDNEIAACFADSLACEATCAAAAIIGVLGCLALGPAAGPCIAAVLTAEVFCIAGCLARQKACNLRAMNEWLLCWLECLEPSP